MLNDVEPLLSDLPADHPVHRVEPIGEVDGLEHRFKAPSPKQPDRWPQNASLWKLVEYLPSVESMNGQPLPPSKKPTYPPFFYTRKDVSCKRCKGRPCVIYSWNLKWEPGIRTNLSVQSAVLNACWRCFASKCNCTNQRIRLIAHQDPIETFEAEKDDEESDRNSEHEPEGIYRLVHEHPGPNQVPVLVETDVDMPEADSDGEFVRLKRQAGSPHVDAQGKTLRRTRSAPLSSEPSSLLLEPHPCSSPYPIPADGSSPLFPPPRPNDPGFHSEIEGSHSDIRHDKSCDDHPLQAITAAVAELRLSEGRRAEREKNLIGERDEARKERDDFREERDKYKELSERLEAELAQYQPTGNSSS